MVDSQIVNDLVSNLVVTESPSGTSHKFKLDFADKVRELAQQGKWIQQIIANFASGVLNSNVRVARTAVDPIARKSIEYRDTSGALTFATLGETGYVGLGYQSSSNVWVSSATTSGSVLGAEVSTENGEVIITFDSYHSWENYEYSIELDAPYWSGSVVQVEHSGVPALMGYYGGVNIAVSTFEFVVADIQ